MAEGKKSFVAYCDWLECFEELTDEEAGRLVKHLFRYVNDQNPEAPDKLTKMLFIPMRQSLKRDLDKYEAYIEKQKENGKRGGRPKKPKKPKPFKENPNEPKKADSDSVSVNDSVNGLSKDNSPQTPQGAEIVFPFDSEEFRVQWQLWKAYKKKQHRFEYKHAGSEQAALTELNNKASGRESKAIEIIHHTMANGWKGFVVPKVDRSETHINFSDL